MLLDNWPLHSLMSRSRTRIALRFIVRLRGGVVREKLHNLVVQAQFSLRKWPEPTAVEVKLLLSEDRYVCGPCGA